MNNYKYSVLMSVYFKENPLFFARSVDSVMNQTIRPDDFVIVCDGPLTDELNNVISEKEKQYKCLNIIRLDKNQGLGIALSIGLTKTKNDFIMRMDSDDVCMPDRAETQIPLLETYDVVGGFVSEFENDEKNIIGVRAVPETKKEILKFIKKRNPFNHPSVCFIKQAVLDAGNYQNLLFFEDYDLWVRILLDNRSVYNLQKILVNMRSGVSMRARRGGKQYRKSLCILRKKMLKAKMISPFNYCFYTFGQIVFSMLPIRVKEKLYKKYLRS